MELLEYCGKLDALAWADARARGEKFVCLGELTGSDVSD